MHKPRWRLTLLTLALLAVFLPIPPNLGHARRVQALGTGAQFLPADTAFYLALDLDPDFEQFYYLDRLVHLYVRAPEVEANDRQLRQTLGISFEELWQEASAWIGGEVFFALPRFEDVEASRRFVPEGSIDIDCREPGWLAGAAIGDRAAFQAFLERLNGRLQATGASAAAESADGVEVYSLSGRDASSAVHLAFRNGYVLVSPTRARLLEAAEQDVGQSLAASASFADARGRFNPRPLAFLYTKVPEEVLGFGGGGISQQSSIEWVAGALNLGPESVRVDVSAAVDPSTLGPATRALMSKSANPVRAARVAPDESLFFVGWENVKLIWDQVVETAWSDPREYERNRLQFLADTGLDLEDDIFGWMTGELALFAAPVTDGVPFLGNVSPGLLLEVKDRAVAQRKLDMMKEAARRNASPDMVFDTAEIAGLTFNRVSFGEEGSFTGRWSLYWAMVEDWVVVTLSPQAAAEVVAGMRGGGSLRTQPEYGLVRSQLADPLQFLGYLDVPRFVAVTTAAIGAAGTGGAEQVDPYVQPIRGAGLAVDTAADRVSAAFYVHLVIPEEAPVFPAQRESERDVSSKDQERVRPQPTFLLDLSHADDVQEAVEVEFRRFGPPIPEGLRPLVVLLEQDVEVRPQGVVRAGQRIGNPYGGNDSRSGRFDPSRYDPDLVQPSQNLLLRIGSEGPYSEAEVEAYRAYVRCGGVLMLLSDGKAPGETDELAAAFGFDVAGVAAGAARMDRYAAHLAAAGVPPLSMAGGTGLVGWPADAQLLGHLSTGSYLDLDGNGLRTGGEPAGAPALAMRREERGMVVFLGTTSVVRDVDHPLLPQLLRDILAGAAPPLAPDAYEPDDTIERAVPIERLPRLSGVLVPRPGGRDDNPRNLHVAGDVDWASVYLGEGQAGTVFFSSLGMSCDLEQPYRAGN